MRGYCVKVVVFGSCLHVGTYDYRVMLCCAGVFNACFACGNSTFLKNFKIELWCVCVCARARARLQYHCTVQ